MFASAALGDHECRDYTPYGLHLVCRIQTRSVVPSVYQYITGERALAPPMPDGEDVKERSPIQETSRYSPRHSPGTLHTHIAAAW